ncbi:MAG: MFS transporter [Phyllobacteriaceae bacterium]|nr:MFS transporter [Phyllobacteriaceae bacterium]
MTSEPVTAPRQRLALASLALAMLLASLGVSIATIALPALSEDLATPMAGAQWVVLAYLLATTVAIVPAGRLGDAYGHRRGLLAGLGLYAAAALACALADSIGWLIAGRLAQGVGAAWLMALSMSAARDIVPAEKTGRAMGLLGSVSAVGTALGPSVGGLLVAGFGWRAVFAVLVPLAVAGFVLARHALPSAAPAGEVRERFDPKRLTILALILAAYALAMTADGRFAPTDAFLLAAAGVGVVLLARVERRAAHPIIDMDAIRGTGFIAGLVTNVLVSAVMMATLVVGPFFLALGLGLGDVLVGLVMAIGPAVAALSGVPAGRLTDRIGASRTLLVGLIQVGLGALLLAWLPRGFGAIGYALALFALTPGYQLFLAALNTKGMLQAPAGRRGTISALLSLSRNLGLITGASAMGAIFAMAVGQADVTGASPDAIGFGLSATFTIGSVLVFCAAGFAAVTGRRTAETDGRARGSEGRE